jgi:hypothetical protein
MQPVLRSSLVACFAALAAACSTETYPTLVVDGSTVTGSLADGTKVSASAGVFGDTADDGSGTVPPLDAVFDVPRSDGTSVHVEIRAPVSFVLPTRAPADVLVCAIDERAERIGEQCDKPSVAVHLDVDQADCSISPCLVDVAGGITISGSSVFNGSVVFEHREQATTVNTPDQQIL